MNKLKIKTIGGINLFLFDRLSESKGSVPRFIAFFQFVSSVFGSAALILPRLGRCKRDPKPLLRRFAPEAWVGNGVPSPTFRF
jgi:hypothetical protein